MRSMVMLTYIILNACTLVVLSRACALVFCKICRRAVVDPCVIVVVACTRDQPTTQDPVTDALADEGKRCAVREPYACAVSMHDRELGACVVFVSSYILTYYACC